MHTPGQWQSPRSPSSQPWMLPLRQALCPEASTGAQLLEEASSMHTQREQSPGAASSAPEHPTHTNTLLKIGKQLGFLF